MLITEAFNRYIQDKILLYNGAEKTGKNYVCARKSLIKAIQDIHIETLTDDHLRRWMISMIESGNKPATQHMNISHLRQVLRYVNSQGIETIDPRTIISPKVHRKKPNILSAQQISLLIQGCDTLRDRLLVSLLFSTGCRIGEALSINRSDVDLEHDKIIVIGKNQKYRPVFLDPRTKLYIEQYLFSRDDELAPLFITSQDTRMTVSRAGQIIDEAVGKVDLKSPLRVTPHTMRHSHATQLMENGMHIRAIQEDLGHERVTTTELYTHVTDKFLMDSLKQYHKT